MSFASINSILLSLIVLEEKSEINLLLYTDSSLSALSICRELDILHALKKKIERTNNTGITILLIQFNLLPLKLII